MNKLTLAGIALAAAALIAGLVCVIYQFIVRASIWLAQLPGF